MKTGRTFTAVCWIVGLMTLLTMPMAAFGQDAGEIRLNGLESTMRKFNARHKYFKGSYVQWPACPVCSSCGGAGGKGEHPVMPEDGYYSEAIKHDPALAASLVGALVQAFYGANTKIYPEFLKLEGQSLDGLSCTQTPPAYQESDFPKDWTTVNTTNFKKVFGKIKGYVEELKTTVVISSSYNYVEMGIITNNPPIGNQHEK
jgi:hypothetical protein